MRQQWSERWKHHQGALGRRPLQVAFEHSAGYSRPGPGQARAQAARGAAPSGICIVGQHAIRATSQIELGSPHRCEERTDLTFQALTLLRERLGREEHLGRG